MIYIKYELNGQEYVTDNKDAVPSGAVIIKEVKL